MAKSDKEKTSIQGTLLMLDDATPHVAVPVQAIRDGEVISTVLSDERGEYQFVGLASGMCQVRCQILGGYVYYGEEKARSLEDMAMPDESISSSAHKPISL
jgi:phosphosulfolactate phosphohydrolase-like enzyme